MDTELIKTFIDVVEAGSLAATARRRDVSVSRVSRSISALEETLGVKLLNRSTRNMVLTAEGEEYLTRVRPVLDALEHANAQVSVKQWANTGTIRVTVPSAFGRMCLLPIFKRYQEINPDLNFEILVTDSIVDLISNRIDLAFRLGRLDDSALYAKKIAAIDYCVVASEQYLKSQGTPSSPEDLNQHNCLYFPAPNSRDNWFFKKHDKNTITIKVSGNFLISDTESLLRATLSSQGITLIPKWAAKAALSQNKLVQLFDDFVVTNRSFDAAIWAVYPSRHYLPNRIKQLIDYVSLLYHNDNIVN